MKQTHIAAQTLLALACLPAALWAQRREAVQQLTIKRGDLSVVFRDNSKSPGLLSGIDSLFHVKHAPDYDAFDPDNPDASAGLNFEHIISGHDNRNNAFTPRHGPYRMYRGTDPSSVVLRRQAEDSPWKIASTLGYAVREPHYIDFEFRCTPQDASLFGERRYAIFFFADYMNDVSQVPIHFRGRRRADGPEEWIAGAAPDTHPHWIGGGTYRSLPATDLKFDDDVKFRLNTWSYDWPRISKPFYYGRAEHGMTLMLMFDRLYSEQDQIRFSIFKFKLKKYPRPAWDFQYVINRVESNREYGFRGRLVWKKFVSPDDCLREYEQWRANLPAEGNRGG